MPLDSNRTGRILPDNGVIDIGGVRYTPGSAKNPNILADEGGALPEIFPVVDDTGLETSDGNDGKADGDQPSFSMPAFASGSDVRDSYQSPKHGDPEAGF